MQESAKNITFADTKPDKNMNIRPAHTDDLAPLMKLFEEAKLIMRQNGNFKQWTKGYPSEEVILHDIQKGYCHVCLDENNQLTGTFSFIPGKDPTYARIYEGAWLDDSQPYGTIHRLASIPDSHGIAHACLEWCGRRIHNLRADTHRDNHILQHILLKHGFHYCGIIYLPNGDERLAYQRINSSTGTPVK